MLNIKYISNAAIDKRLWDSCINDSLYGNIYATSAYLDNLATNWDALIVNDYEIIMPIIYRQKYGIKYLYQPAFLPYVGIFSKSKIDDETTNAFFTALLSFFKFAEIAFAYPLNFSSKKEKLQITPSNNFVLQLNKSYESLYDNFHEHFKNGLKKVQKLKLQYSTSTDIKSVINLYKALYSDRIKSITDKDINNFSKLCTVLQNNNNIAIRNILDNNENVLASVILLVYKDRLYNILPCVTTEGRRLRAGLLLFDRIIEEFSDKNFTLDFEGSDIKGIADFYLKMNPENEPFCTIRYNNLSFPFNLFKR